MNIISKLYQRRKDFRYILHSIYFNFHYLPFKQAIHLPILLYKPNLKKMAGTVKIETPDGKVKRGMIRLGFPMVSIYPNNGIMWENHGGTIVFKGRTSIGNDSYLSFGPSTIVELDAEFKATASLKMISYRGIKFGKHVIFGWGCLVMDTNIHPLYDMVKKTYKRASGLIEIGDHNWFGTQCKIMHSVITPERCIFGMNTTITRGSVAQSYSVMGGAESVKILSEDVMLDYEHYFEDN